MTRHAYRRDGQLKHSVDCSMAFGKLDPEHCARCEQRQAEKAQGIPARRDYGKAARELDAQRLTEVRRHDCKASGCSIVCTAFDW